MSADSTVAEADRIMTICNACRYCEGYCAVFPAMTQRLSFNEADLNYLANLCHGCRGCYYSCQYAPPHQFAVNVPQTLAELRVVSYQTYAWPGFLAGLYQRNGLTVACVTALALAVVMLLTLVLQDGAVLFGNHSGEGAFYRVMPHHVMAYPAAAVFLFALLAMGIGVNRFWRDSTNPQDAPATGASLWQALKDTATLRYLGGGRGEQGCNYPDESFSHSRRWFHQLTLYGFLLCFASTSIGTVYHYLFGWQAPYGWFSLPVILGTAGGGGLLVGTGGLFWLQRLSDPAPEDNSQTAMDTAFIVLLFLTSLTGLVLLALRETSAMGMLLAVHLGVVLGLFLLLPYSKFVHGLYRFAALLKFAREQSQSGVN